MPDSVVPSMRNLPFSLLVVATAVAMVVAIPFLFLGTPVAQEAAGGIAQRIFYFHVPSAVAMYLGGTVCFGASVAFLLGETDQRDAMARAGAEVAVLFGAMVLVSGPLWAKKAWGVYWTWDPRLTTSLLSWTIYVAIVVFRRFGGEGSVERRATAAMGVLGWFLLWLVHWSVQLWGGNHPTVIGRGGGGLGDPRMGQALGLGFLAIGLLAATLVWLRTRVYALEARIIDVEHQTQSGEDD